MEILTFLKKTIFYCTTLIMLFNGCNEAIAPDLNNKNDHDAASFRGELPSDLKLTIISDNDIKIEWKDNSNYEKGYTIERSLNNENNFIPIGQVGPNVTTFIDSNAVIYNSYIYRVRISNIITKVTAEISSEPYTEKIKLAENAGDFCLSPNGQYVALSRNQVVTVIKISDGREIFSCPATSVIRFAICNNLLAVASTYSASEDKSVINIWRIRDGSLYTSFKTNGQVDGGMAFNHNEDILAIGDFITLSIWNIGVTPSLIVRKCQDLDGFGRLEFSKDDEYLMSIKPSTSSGFSVYSSHTWEILYKKGIPDNIFPYFINNDVVFYRDNSFVFYSLKKGITIGTIKDTLNIGIRGYPENAININNPGSILSIYKYNDDPNSSTKNLHIDLWLIKGDILLRKLQTFYLGNELPTENAFSSRNDFLLLTSANNLYLWKYY